MGEVLQTTKRREVHEAKKTSSGKEVSRRGVKAPIALQMDAALRSRASSCRYSVVSLFSGCGGLDLGFIGGFHFAGRNYDPLPFDIVWANDLDNLACDTYAANIGDDHLIRGDVSNAINTLPKTADVIIGGFPCQDVSINGRRTLARGQRTVLYQYMIDAIRRCNPTIFVAENVKGLLMANGKRFLNQMVEDFSLPGYFVESKLYLAADYGVPQRRERVFIIGVREHASFTHPIPKLKHMTTQEALSDLEDAAENRTTSHIWSRAKRSPEQGNRQLKADDPATTIRAEHHGNIQWHYKLNRRISLREAARLQSFPDDFVFTSAMRATERQIGNAVPPVMAWHIASAVRDHLEQ